MIFRRRWLSLVGLAVLIVGILVGPTFHNRWLSLGIFFCGLALMLIQIPFAVRNDLRMMKGADPQKKV